MRFPSLVCLVPIFIFVLPVAEAQNEQLKLTQDAMVLFAGQRMEAPRLGQQELAAYVMETLY